MRDAAAFRQPFSGKSLQGDFPSRRRRQVSGPLDLHAGKVWSDLRGCFPQKLWFERAGVTGATLGSAQTRQGCAPCTAPRDLSLGTLFAAALWGFAAFLMGVLGLLTTLAAIGASRQSLRLAAAPLFAAGNGVQDSSRHHDGAESGVKRTVFRRQAQGLTIRPQRRCVQARQLWIKTQFCFVRGG